MDISNVNIATHYRPLVFKDVVGQDVPCKVLTRVARAEGISVRAIFLKGAYGSGKSTLARIFGRAMNCSKFKELGDVCNECDNCKDLFTKNNQLYYEYDSAVTGNVENIRNLDSLFSIAPQGRRVVVFDEVHASSNAALNALLKMVEEGVRDTIFVFCSTEDILSTLKSRSIILDVTTIPVNLIIKRVKEIAEIRNIQISSENLQILALKSAGHMRDALSTLQLYEICGEDALTSSYNTFKEFMQLVVLRDTAAYPKIDELVRFNIVDLKNSICSYIKNIYLAKPDTPESHIRKTGIHHSMFGYFYTPVAQQAMRDEIGIEILLQAFVAKVIK